MEGKVLTSKRAEKVGQKGKLQNATPGGERVEHNSGLQCLMVRDSHNEDRRTAGGHPSSRNQRAAWFFLMFSPLCFTDTHFLMFIF